jgi:predicted transcriptional regulator
MNDPYSGKAKVSFKCSDALYEMLDASARFEHRAISQICRMALAEYFASRGYFDPENISKLAAGRRIGETDE